MYDRNIPDKISTQLCRREVLTETDKTEVEIWSEYFEFTRPISGICKWVGNGFLYFRMSQRRKDGRKEMYYLTTHSIHYYFMVIWRRLVVKDHSDSERGKSLPPHGLLFPISRKGFFYKHHPTYRITHTTNFDERNVEHWQEHGNAQMVHHEDRSHDQSNHKETRYHGARSRSPRIFCNRLNLFYTC